MSLNHLDRLGTSINEGNGNIDEDCYKVRSENRSVYLDLASGKGNEELDSRIYHLKLLYVNSLSDPKAGPGSTKRILIFFS